jgi:hypothetical protein
MPDRGATAALLLALGLALCRSPPCRRTCSCKRAPFRCSTAESGSHSYLSALLWFLSCLQFPDISAFGLMKRPAALLSAIESIALSRRFKRSLCGQDGFLSKLKKGASASCRCAVKVV